MGSVFLSCTLQVQSESSSARPYCSMSPKSSVTSVFYIQLTPLRLF